MKRHFFILFFLLSFAFSISAQEKEAQMFSNISAFGCEDLKASIYDFITKTAEEKDSKAYVIVYEGKIKKFNYDKENKFSITYILPRTGEANSLIKLIKLHFRYLAYPPEDVVIIKGGFRENLTAEFWIVPKTAEVPKPTPTLKKIKHRKGQAAKNPQMGDC